MKKPVILAIDEGTTNAKAVCVDPSGQIVSKGAIQLSIHHPNPAWSEQDPTAILNAVYDTSRMALSQVPEGELAGIGISNQRESVLIWERNTGKPLTPVVTWQCRRSEAFCQSLAKSENAAMVQQRSGLPVDPLFPAAKIKWLLEHLEDGIQRAKDGEICVGTIDCWLVWNLTGKQAFVTDPSNASRTQLYNIKEGKWDEDLLSIFGIPLNMLPDVKPSSEYRGVTSGVDGLPDGVPIVAQIGDSHAALYGQGGFIPGVIKATYGTGSSLMTPVQSIVGDDYRLAQTVAWDDGELTYALEGNITHAGAGMAYISKLLGVADLSDCATLAESVTDSHGVYFVPALSGLGAPYWRSDARGLISGLTESATREHLARAALESIAFQVADVYFLMKEMSGQSLDTLLVDGGPTQNATLMQLQADLIQKPVVRSLTAEVSALGAGYLAGKALGWWQNRSVLNSLARSVEIIEPAASKAEIDDRYEGWKSAIARVLS